MIHAIEKHSPGHLRFSEMAGAGALPRSPTPKAMPMSNAASVPCWVFDVNLPDRLVRALVAAYSFADAGVWRAGLDSARALGVTDRTLRNWCAALVRAGMVTRVGRASYELRGGLR